MSLSAVDSDALQLRILLSYHYYRNIDIHDLFAEHFEKPYPDLFLDSGAFSAHTQGEEIDIDEYAEWVKHHKDLATVYANLDSIGNATQTTQNQRVLEQRHGLAPLPVFHMKEPWSVLEGLCEQYEYVGLGGMVGEAKKCGFKAWLARCFTIGKESETVFHGFGITSWEIMREFPWYSVDSSSWGDGFRYAEIRLFDERLGRFVQIQRRKPQKAFEHRKLIESYGIDCADIADEARYDRKLVCRISALAYMRAERWLRCKKGTEQQGGSIYLVENQYDLRDIKNACKSPQATQ